MASHKLTEDEDGEIKQHMNDCHGKSLYEINKNTLFDCLMKIHDMDFGE